MTEQQLKDAAYELCRLRGLDPEQEVGHGADPGPSGATCDVWLYSSRWERVAREIVNIHNINQAIKVGLGY